ncbi:MAG: glycosyltransferase family 2 protein [Candidatus Kapabacteria bacterium]|jgi:glycosyltransferase involved in cell wall biosynthesis|nr:glycosyltransferase family 2 protein [Candidatus Kapabacteria bacterium]
MSDEQNDGSRQHNQRRRGGQQRRRHYGNDDRSRQGGRSYSSDRPRERRSLDSISVVIPLLNEEESLPELAQRLEYVLERVAPRMWDVLFIDDGSSDASYNVIAELHARNPRFKCIRFRRNNGKSAALGVAFAEVEGDIVITMDADLQDDPKEIPALLSKLDEGYDLVSGWKRKRYDPWHKTMPSKLFNAVTSAMSGIKLHDFNCGLKAYRKDVVKTVQVYGEMHRYIPALAHWEGFRVTEIPVQHHARKYGYSKFGASRFMKGFLDLLTVMFTTRYVKRPLHFFGAFGALFALIGFITDAWLVIEWSMGLTNISQRPLALFGVAMIIVGVQLISIGLIGELIVKNNLERQNYAIRERLG